MNKIRSPQEFCGQEGKEAKILGTENDGVQKLSKKLSRHIWTLTKFQANELFFSQLYENIFKTFISHPD